MADNKEQLAAGGLGFGLGALLLALMNGKPVAASGQDLSTLLAAISAGLDTENQTLQAILDALHMQGSGTAAAVPNCKNIQSTRIVISPLIGVGVAYRLPHFFIPDGFALKIKAGFANGGQIYVSDSSAGAVNVNTSEELNRGEFTLYKIQDAYSLWVSGNILNDYLTLTSEVP